MSTEGDKRPANRVTVLFRTLPSSLKISSADRLQLRQFARTLSREVLNAAPFTCLLSNDEELQRLNRSFLRQDYPTDVLSFPAADGSQGELAISAERAAEQASSYGHSLCDEIKILMLHGVLHLAGFDHEADRGEMARAEAQWRGAFALPSGLIERAQPARGVRRQ